MYRVNFLTHLRNKIDMTHHMTCSSSNRIENLNRWLVSEKRVGIVPSKYKTTWCDMMWPWFNSIFHLMSYSDTHLLWTCSLDPPQTHASWILWYVLYSLWGCSKAVHLRSQCRQTPSLNRRRPYAFWTLNAEGLTPYRWSEHVCLNTISVVQAHVDGHFYGIDMNKSWAQPL